MKKIVFFITAITLFTACTQTSPTITPDKESILRTGRWKLSSGTVTLKNPNGIDTTLNYMQFIAPCHLDDYIKFDSLNSGATFPGPLLCSAADADSIGFNWRLLNSDNNIDILNVFNFFYIVYDSIQLPYYFDTVSTSPLVLDTLSTSPTLVLDTIWHLRFDSMAVAGNTIGTGVNIYNADISNFSKSSFTLSFKWYSQYHDSTGGKEGGPPNFATQYYKPDTLRYVLNYVNF